MEGFFKEYEINKISKNKKIGWIFRQLLIKRDLKDIHLNYPDVLVTNENEILTIKGSDFIYQFGEEEIFMVWKRMKKAIK